MAFVPPLQISRANSMDEQLQNFSRRSQRVCHENERSNLLALTQLVLNSFLDDQIRGTRILDALETREINDFFIMLEKCLWHGFKTPVSPIVGRRKQPEAEIWHFIEVVASQSANSDMDELYKSVAEMNHLSTPLCKFRAFWRLAMMQKRLAQYFECLYDSDVKKDFYEPWALLRADACAFLGGAFLALGVFDCNFLIDNDQFQEQINSFDLSPYLRLPTLPGHISSEMDIDDELMLAHNSNKPGFPSILSTTATTNGSEEYTDLTTILDQKQYLEERNRQLSVNLEILKLKLEKTTIENGSLNSGSSDDRSLIFTERLRDLERERDILRARLTEKEDTLRIIQDQLEGMRRFTEDLYEKLRAADTKTKRVQRDMQELKDLHQNEVTELRSALSSLDLLPTLINSTGSVNENVKEETKSNNDDLTEKPETNPQNKLRQELANKTKKYVEAIEAVKKKQEELSREHQNSEALRRRCAEQEARIEALVRAEKELFELREEYKHTKQELTEAKLALQEFSQALSESKLRMVELKEEIMPLSEAQWIRDSEVAQCRLCDVHFSVLHRRHHCRNCGQIFCNTCSSGRVKLPSNFHPVRVCLNCFHLLRNRQLTIASLVDPRNRNTSYNFSDSSAASTSTTYAPSVASTSNNFGEETNNTIDDDITHDNTLN